MLVGQYGGLWLQFVLHHSIMPTMLFQGGMATQLPPEWKNIYLLQTPLKMDENFTTDCFRINNYKLLKIYGTTLTIFTLYALANRIKHIFSLYFVFVCLTQHVNMKKDITWRHSLESLQKTNKINNILNSLQKTNNIKHFE